MLALQLPHRHLGGRNDRECRILSFSARSSLTLAAAACQMAEMYNRRPLLPGTSEVHQMLLTCEALGSPSPATWSEGCRAASKIGFKFPAVSQLLQTPVLRAHSVLTLLLVLR